MKVKDKAVKIRWNGESLEVVGAYESDPLSFKIDCIYWCNKQVGTHSSWIDVSVLLITNAMVKKEITDICLYVLETEKDD